MDRWSNKVAIVTGASSGIGESIAENLTKLGMQVVGLARRVKNVEKLSQKLEEAQAKGKLHPFKCDMRQEEDILAVFEWTAKNLGNVHLLVNNAGVITKSNLSEGSTEDWRSIVETNLLGVAIATREAIKVMKTHAIEGQIININSIAGLYHLYFPTIGIYGATKHGAKNMADILRQEMMESQTNIKVTSIYPGLVRTNVFNLETMPEEDLNKMLTNTPLECQDIADCVYYVLSVPHRVHINDITLRSLHFPL